MIDVPDEYDDLEILSKPSSFVRKNNVNISDEFYDMVEQQWGFEAPVIVEHVTDSHYFLKVSSVHFVYYTATHTWDILDRYF